MMRRFRRRPSGLWLSAAALAVLVVVRLAYDFFAARDLAPRERPLRDGPCEFIRIVDAENIVVRQSSSVQNGDAAREVSIRLLGVVRPRHGISPRDRQFVESAQSFSREFLTVGRPRLQLDKRQLDDDQQFVAYVFVGDRMLNEELARAGFVRIATRPGDSQAMTRRLRAAEDEARRRGRGLWANESSETPPPEMPTRDDC